MSFDFTYQPGGLYAYKDTTSTEYHLFRLITCNAMANGTLHVQPYQESFDDVSGVESAGQLQPTAQHLPINLRTAMTWSELRLLGSKPFTAQDLAGYGLYLAEAQGLTESEAALRIERIVKLSQLPAVTATVTYDDDSRVNIDIKPQASADENGRI